MDLSPFLEPSRRLGLVLTEDRLESLKAFGTALYERNEVVNLTRVPFEQCAVRHFLDSVLIFRLLPSGARVLDIGCGPGFPSWPLALVRPDLSVTALDSWRKGLDFLREHPLPNLEVMEGRAEELGRQESYDVVTGRAFAPFAVQAECSAAWLKVGGAFVPFRTPVERGTAESFRGEGLGLQLETVEASSLPDGAGERLFPVFRKVSRTDRKYPRRWAEMKSRPLA
ncbi:MAG: 16S rRNA (guanine(527)-N(7))-methyltransferase RsmG [Armatimonadetes bacterium]|nr:16S rRNA (guanine(527)-N(7))-methyltransferase RsmG [Armatimonadota bacterium]